MQKNYSLAWSGQHKGKSSNSKPPEKSGDSALIKKIIRRASSVRGQVILVQLPFYILEHDELIVNFAENVSTLSSFGVKVIIVHGYDGIIDKKLKEFGVSQKEQGSIFDQEKISKIAEMIISGRINRDIITKLCLNGVNAIGFSGKDANLIVAERPRWIIKSDGSDFKFNCIGTPIMVNPDLLASYEDNEITAVISPVACSPNGRTIILDPYSTASMIAASVQADHFVILSDEYHFKDKFLRAFDGETLKASLANIGNFPAKNLLGKAAYYAMENTECSVSFADAKQKDALLFAMFD